MAEQTPLDDHRSPRPESARHRDAAEDAIDVSPPDAQINQDLSFSRRTWVVQRIGWVTMGLVLLAALAGLFGRGVLSAASAQSPSQAVRIEYERFVRNRAPTKLAIHVQTAQAQRFTLNIAHSYFDSVKLESITPEPIASRAGPDHLAFEFQATPGAAQATVIMRFDVQQMGSIHGRLWVDRQPQALHESPDLIPAPIPDPAPAPAPAPAETVVWQHWAYP